MRPMKIDTHVHLLIDKQSRPCKVQIRLLFKHACKIGLSGLVITEHRDAAHFESLVRRIFLQNEFGLDQVESGHLRTNDGVSVYSGAEISIAGGGDVGVHASPDVVLGLSNARSEYTVASLRRALEESGEPFLMVAHHLLNPGKWLTELDVEPHLVHAIEIPGKAPNEIVEYISLVKSMNKPACSGSDAHVWIQLGAGSTDIELEAKDSYRKEFFAKVTSGNTRCHLSPDSEEIVGLARECRAKLLAGNLEETQNG